MTATNNSSPALWSGTFTAGYDSDGRLVTQTDPNNVTSTLGRDEAGQLLSRTDTQNGSPWLTDEVGRNIFGQTVSHDGPAGNHSYGYDAAGRLSLVQDTPTIGPCTTRRYLFDANSNRTGLTSTTAADQTCGAGTAPTATISYDTADRLQTTGTVYDSFGRTTTAPAASVTGGSNLTVGYFANDLVASQTQGSTTQSWTLDPGQQRLRTATTVVSGTTTKTETNHYDDASSDSPDWIAETADASSWTANVSDLLGSLAVTVDQTGAATFAYANLHGDIQATSAAGAAAPTISPDVDEYGNTPAGSSVPRYGWLGGKQRSGEDLAGLLLMGVRLYNPTTARFLQTDPIAGGSCNDYDYTCQDPINNSDLDGRMLAPEGGGSNECTCTSKNRSWHTYDTTYGPASGWVHKWINGANLRKAATFFQSASPVRVADIHERSRTVSRQQWRCRNGHVEFRTLVGKQIQLRLRLQFGIPAAVGAEGVAKLAKNLPLVGTLVGAIDGYEYDQTSRWG